MAFLARNSTSSPCPAAACASPALQEASGQGELWAWILQPPHRTL